MYTRCPGCHTVHPVNASLLTQGAGKYRCGKCKQVNTALNSLFDEWPDPGEDPAERGKLPLLGIAIDLEAAKQSRLTFGGAAFFNDEEGEESSGMRRNKKILRAAWITIAFALLVLVTLYLADFFHQPLLNSAHVEERNLDQIELLSRDMRSHPSRPSALSLSLTIVNRAPHSQAFPKLEVILLDSSGQALVSRLFKPGEYLAQDADIETGMTPQAYLHINLDLADPGSQAVGFELHFR